MLIPEQLQSPLRHRIFYAIGGLLDALAIASLVVLLGLALLGVGGCNFITEGEPGESSSSSGDGVDRPPRWPLPSSAEDTSTTPSTTSSSTSSSSVTSTSTSTSSAESSSSSSSDGESSSSDDGETSSSSDAESSSSDDGGTCAHGLCEGGVALEPECSECVNAVCGADDYCCTRSWDQICIDLTNELCANLCA